MILLSQTGSTRGLISTCFTSKHEMRTALRCDNGVRDFLWANGHKINYCTEDRTRETSYIECSDCQRRWDQKFSLYQILFPARKKVATRLAVFRQKWFDIKVSTINKHFTSDICSVFNRKTADASSVTEDDSVSALQSLILYTIDGIPIVTTLGVQRVFGRSTGANLKQLFQDLVTGEHLKSEVQTGKTLHSG